MSTSSKKLIGLIGVLVLIFFSCRQDADKTKDSVIDIRLAKQPEKLNPVFFPNSLAREVNQYIFLPLADFDPITYALTPLLIKSIPVKEIVNEGKHAGEIKYSFEILENAKWDDGQPITGNDYLFTLKAILHPGTSAAAYRSLVQNIVSVEVDASNNRKVSAYYKEPYINALELVVNIELLPKHIYDSKGILDKVSYTDLLIEEQAEKKVAEDSTLIQFAEQMNSPEFTKETVVGCGPYQLEAWNTDQNIILRKKENYWAAGRKETSFQQQPEKIIFHFIPDETAALTRLHNKEIDVVTGINMNNFEQLKKDSFDQYYYHTPQLIKLYCILLNMKDPVLQSKSVRKALASVINVDQMINTFEKGAATRTIGFINPIKPYYHKKLTPYPYSLDAASNYLKADGWTDTNKNGILDKKINGKTTELNIELYYSGELGQNISLLIKDEAKKIGMNLDIVKKDIALLRKENLATGKYSAAMQLATADLGLDDLKLRFHSSNAELGEGNLGFYINPRVDQLIDAINESSSESERNKMYLEFQEIIHEDLPYIFLYSPKERIVTSKKWKSSSNAKRPGYQANTFTPA